MHAITVDHSNLADFLTYCADHQQEFDESYLPGPGFAPDAENPAYMLRDDSGSVIGAVCLMMTPTLRAAGRARFRILHALDPSVELYSSLVDAVRPHAAGLPELYLLLDEAREQEGRAMLELGFLVQRKSWEMRRSCAGAPMPQLPPGYGFRVFEPRSDEAVWARVVNAAFAHLRGHADCGADFVRDLQSERGHWPAGMVLLTHGGEVVGLLRVMEDEADPGVACAFIGPLAVLEGHRGQGLGRALLQLGLHIGAQQGQTLAVLSVNAENDRAVELYAKESFEKHRVMVCYSTVA